MPLNQVINIIPNIYFHMDNLNFTYDEFSDLLGLDTTNCNTFQRHCLMLHAVSSLVRGFVLKGACVPESLLDLVHILCTGVEAERSKQNG